MATCIDFDTRLQLPNHMLVVGMTMSGKSRLVMRLLSDIDRFDPVPRTVYFYYDQYQDMYTDVQTSLAARGVDMILRHGCNVKLDDFEKHDHQTLVIVDDATEATSSSSDVAKMCTNARHKRLSLILCWHSLYSKHPASRLITQNISYFFFLPAVRLTSQLYTLDTQLRLKGKLVDSYALAISDMSVDYRHLLLDISPNSQPQFRLRSCVHSDIQVAYI